VDKQNVHFVSFSTEHMLLPGSEQYEFLSADLQQAHERKKKGELDWIIIMAHKVRSLALLPQYCPPPLPLISAADVLFERPPFLE
jgi:hypothetical protein